MVQRRDPIERVVDVAFGVPIAGTAFARDLTKFALHGALRTARRAGTDLAVRFVDDRADSSTRETLLRWGAGGEPSAETDPDLGEDATGADEVTVIEELTISDSMDAGGDTEIAVDVDTLAIDGYEHLGARQIVGLLEELTEAELAEIERYERLTRGRRTVLGKIEQLHPNRTEP